jgi:hypothetical protein
VNEYVQALIHSRQPVEVAALTDQGIPLGSLAAELALEAEGREPS